MPWAYTKFSHKTTLREAVSEVIDFGGAECREWFEELLPVFPDRRTIRIGTRGDDSGRFRARTLRIHDRQWGKRGAISWFFTFRRPSRLHKIVGITSMEGLWMQLFGVIYFTPPYRYSKKSSVRFWSTRF